MKQRSYETPEIVIVRLSTEDVITTSGVGNDEKIAPDIFDAENWTGIFRG